MANRLTFDFFIHNLDNEGDSENHSQRVSRSHVDLKDRPPLNKTSLHDRQLLYYH